MSRWDPKLPIDVHPWSLLPNIGLSRRAAIVAEVIWTAYVTGFFLYWNGELWKFALLGLFGGWALYYIACRLGGRVARELGAAPAIDRESPYQMRLLADVLHIGFVLLSAIVIALGFGR